MLPFDGPVALEIHRRRPQDPSGFEIELIDAARNVRLDNPLATRELVYAVDGKTVRLNANAEEIDFIRLDRSPKMLVRSP